MDTIASRSSRFWFLLGSLLLIALGVLHIKQHFTEDRGRASTASAPTSSSPDRLDRLDEVREPVLGLAFSVRDELASMTLFFSLFVSLAGVQNVLLLRAIGQSHKLLRRVAFCDALAVLGALIAAAVHRIAPAMMAWALVLVVFVLAMLTARRRVAPLAQAAGPPVGRTA